MMLSLDILWLGYAAAAVGIALALVAVLARPHTLSRASFALAMLVVSLETLFATLAAHSTSDARLAFWFGLRFGMTALVAPCWIFFSAGWGRGDQKEALRNRAGILAAVFVVSLLILAGFRSSFVTAVAWADAGQSMILSLGAGSTLLHAFLMVGSVVILLLLEQTFRAAVGVMRWRMKFMILAVGILFLARIYTTSQALIYQQWWMSLDVIHAVALLAACLLTAVAMTRAGLSLVEVYPSRRVILGSVTLTLVGLYLVGVGLFSQLAEWVGGRGAFALQASFALAGAVLLALILLSDRLRQRLSAFVSRNFRRPTHDYRSVWQQFAERTAAIVNEADLCRVAAEITSETFEANSVSLWVIDQDRMPACAASTHLSRKAAEGLWQKASPSEDLVEGLRGCKGPLDLQKPDYPSWAAGLKRYVALQNKGMLDQTLCLPLRSANDLVGIMLVGSRVNRIAFTAEDFDLLKTVSLEIGRGMRAIRLARRLVDAREIEAFRSMSAFMAHDLKNTASTLSLTLQNLRKHFDKPDFREDALRAVNQSVLHLNEVISGLSVLREGLQVEPVAGSLNELVESTLGELEGGLTVKVQRNLQPLPPVLIDAAHVKTVLVNLLLNARDAVDGDGAIEVATQVVHQWAQLRVSDNGCGMPEDFVRDSLFRPFRTTKKRGLGIGMFQSKLIVESHRGSIHVESAPGQGATFRILLPLAAQPI